MESRSPQTEGATKGEPPLIVGIGGTARPSSSSERALGVALAVVSQRGGRTLTLRARELDLPMYTPENPDRTPSATRLVEAISGADGLIVATPGYHGGISGLIKNALDYIEDLRDRDRPYLDGRAVGCIVTASGWQATATTLVSLRSVVHALRGWPTPLGVAINSREPPFDADGQPLDPVLAEQLHTVGNQVLEFALAHRG